MELNKAELRILEMLSSGEDDSNSLASKLNLSKSQVYRLCKKLQDSGIIKQYKPRILAERKIHITLLLQLLSNNLDLIPLLAGSGIKILTQLIEPKKVEQIISETGYLKSIVYRKLKLAEKISAVKKKEGRYELNHQVWPLLGEFITEYGRYKQNLDLQAPVGAVIYCNNSRGIVFASKAELDFPLTAFSAYDKFGIKLLLTTNYYHISDKKRKLSKTTVFMHSLYVAEKEKTVRNLIFISLFFIKFRSSMSRVHHPIVKEIKHVLRGGKLPGYPTLDEIRDRAEVYDIRI